MVQAALRLSHALRSMLDMFDEIPQASQRLLLLLSTLSDIGTLGWIGWISDRFLVLLVGEMRGFVSCPISLG